MYSQSLPLPLHSKENPPTFFFFDEDMDKMEKVKTNQIYITKGIAPRKRKKKKKAQKARGKEGNREEGRSQMDWKILEEM